jgi:D-amino peptidase
MHVYISVDMEGIAGIATLDQTIRGGHGYPRAQQLMTAETNAVIAAAFAAGAESVLVNDSHGTMDNLLHAELDPRARLVFGSPKLQCMAEGLSADHDIALFVGYHAPAGSHGVLSHTFSGYFTDVRLNGTTVSEADVNALLAGSLGVPVGMVSGDDVICRLVERDFPGVRTVEVKTARGWSAANSLAPSRALAALASGTREAIARAGDLRPRVPPDVLALAIEMPDITSAELAEAIPGVRRTSPRTVEAELGTAADVVGLITVAYQLANAGMRTRMAPLNRV